MHRLRFGPAAPFQLIAAALRQGVDEQGFLEGRNVAIEQRWADNQRNRLPELAADLVRRRAAVIVTHGGAVEAARMGQETPRSCLWWATIR
jgi:putative ABC transport system substrate-binding protein